MLGALLASAQGELKWLTDFEEGKKVAAESGKTLLVDFTGSDWCHWCIKLKEEVFSQDTFEVAAEKYVLVELDFPHGEDLISPEQRGKNEALAHKLGVQGFPSIILFDEKGRAFARTGYEAGGPEAYLKHLEEISQPYTALKAAEGDARQAALAAFLKTLAGEDIEASFQDEFEELKALDPKDDTGLIAELEAAKAMAEFEDSVEEHLSAGDFDAVLASVDSFLSKHEPQGEKRQHVLMGRVMVYVEQGEKEKAFTELDKMAALAPESQLAQNVEEIKVNISEHLELRAKREEEGVGQEMSEPEELHGEGVEVIEEEETDLPKPVPVP